MSHLRSIRLRRRTFLGGSLGAGLAATLLRRLEASAASGPPTRFLMIHKPCGTIPDRFFPKGGTPTGFQMGPITAAFEPLKNDLVIFDNLTAPRDAGWQGDRHGAGLISMVSGSRAVDDGEPINNDDQFHHITAPTPSIDQLLLTQSARLKAMGVGSANLGSYRDSVRGGRIYPEGGAANFRPLSYQASDSGGLPTPIFPEVRPDVAVRNIFGSALPGGGADVARQQQRNKSILDLIAKDLGTLRKQVPSSERAKLDSHLDAIQKMETLVATSGGNPTSCVAPMVQPLMTTIPPGSPPGARIDALDHDQLSRTQLQTIKTAFQCDLMRVATFSYGHGNQDVQFQYILNSFGTTSGFHDISHLQDPAAVNQLSAVDTWYCARVAEFLTDLKNTPESDGSSMLDNTLVVFFSDVSVGWNHDLKRMPVVFFGGKSVGLRRGLSLDMKGQYMNDLWASVLLAFGVPLPSDNKFAGYNVWKGVTGPRLGAGAIPGIFG